MEISEANNGQHAHTILLGQLTRLDGAIEKEFTLIADRMTWMMLSETFIFGAFAASVMSYSRKEQLSSVSIVLMILLPVLGMAIALLVHGAIKERTLLATNSKMIDHVWRTFLKEGLT